MNSYNQNDPGNIGENRYYHPPSSYSSKDPVKKELRKNANIVGFGMLLLYGLSILVVIIIYLCAGMFSLGRMTTEGYAILENFSSLIAYILGFLIPVIIMVGWIRIPTEIAFPMKTPRMSLLIPGIFLCLGVSVIGAYLSEYVSVVIQSIFGVTPTMPDMSVPEQPVSIFIYCLNLIIAPAFLEEMMFRGVIMQSLRRFGDSFALVTSSILFAMAHGNLVQGPNTLIVGIVIGYMVLRTGSLWTGIIIHFVNNGIAVMAELAMRYTTPEQDVIINGVMLTVYVLGGLIAFAVLLINNRSIFRIAPSTLQMPESRKYTTFFTSVLPIIVTIVTIIITAQFFKPI